MSGWLNLNILTFACLIVIIPYVFAYFIFFIRIFILLFFGWRMFFVIGMQAHHAIPEVK